jgi:PleD family two-component response regulator
LLIVSEDHTRLEREAKIESYSNAFRRAWSSGSIAPESASALADLRKKFRITLEEHEQIEAKLLWELRPSQKARILIIDDDEKLLKLVANTLEDAGFQSVAFTTSDEAYSFLQSQTPDAIVSDINLETSTMGGFTFYEKVREIERLSETPFIFLTGLTDEVLIRTGKEMGVDDYMTKPFSENNLIATIKGRLKRSRQIKKSRQKK